MKIRHAFYLGLATLSLVAASGMAWVGLAEAQRANAPTSTLVETVRTSTERFKDVAAAGAAGYGLLHGCVAGPQEGAMGVHYVNPELVGDGVLDPMRPEALIYEFRNGKPELVGVEYIVVAEAWHAKYEAPPVLMGQLLQYTAGPNRYGLPGFYELHVWSGKHNPRGTFADWNPAVSCDEYVPAAADHGAHN